MSETPKTDRAEFNYATSGGGWGKPFDFARGLERENARLRKSLVLALSRLERLNAEETGPCPACEAIRRDLENAEI